MCDIQSETVVIDFKNYGNGNHERISLENPLLNMRSRIVRASELETLKMYNSVIYFVTSVDLYFRIAIGPWIFGEWLPFSYMYSKA